MLTAYRPGARGAARLPRAGQQGPWDRLERPSDGGDRPELREGQRGRALRLGVWGAGLPT